MFFLDYYDIIKKTKFYKKNIYYSVNLDNLNLHKSKLCIKDDNWSASYEDIHNNNKNNYTKLNKLYDQENFVNNQSSDYLSIPSDYNMRLKYLNKITDYLCSQKKENIILNNIYSDNDDLLAKNSSFSSILTPLALISSSKNKLNSLNELDELNDLDEFKYLKNTQNTIFVSQISNLKINNFADIYLINLLNFYYDYNIVSYNCEYPLLGIKNFIPLPSKLLIDSNLYTDKHLITYDNILKEYQFKGGNGCRTIFANRILPNNTIFQSKNKEHNTKKDLNDKTTKSVETTSENFIKNDNIKFPLPFSFPIFINDSQINILSSNVYYYEVTIKYNKNIDNISSSQEYIAIGYGNKNILLNTHLGSIINSIGYFSISGNVQNNFYKIKENIKVSVSWFPGDTAGAGIIYLSTNKIKLFFTLNGKLVYITKKSIDIDDIYFPVINYNHSHSIDVNFSNKKFIYNIKPLILDYSQNIISSENSFIENYNINPYLNKPPKKINIPKFILNYINSVLENNALTNSSTLFTTITPFNTTHVINDLNISSFSNDLSEISSSSYFESPVQETNNLNILETMSVTSIELPISYPSEMISQIIQNNTNFNLPIGIYIENITTISSLL